MQEYYLETALLRRLCRGMKEVTQPCFQNDGTTAFFLVPSEDGWARLESFEMDIIVAFARAGHGQ